MLSTATLFRDDGDDKVSYLMLLISSSHFIITQRFGALNIIFVKIVKYRKRYFTHTAIVLTQFTSTCIHIIVAIDKDFVLGMGWVGTCPSKVVVG